jgi:predicted NBD/HSP70 family sugar kinase
LVLQGIIAGDSSSRADIARSTGLTPATVSNLVAELIEEGLVEETGTGPSAGGKPPTLLGLNAEAQSVIAVDLSDGRLVGALLDLRGAAIRRSPSQPIGRGQEAIDQLIDTVDDLLAAAGRTPMGIGVGTPGVVDDDGTVIEASNLGWRTVPVGSLLAERYGAPVHVVNNSRAAALAEYSFGGHESENLLVVKIGNGIGAGVVLDGRVHGGEDSAAGEIGHVVVAPGGPACSCGKNGCLETIAAVPHLVRAIHGALSSESRENIETLEAAARAAAAGDRDVITILDELGSNLGHVLSTTVAILDIHLVVLSGVISRLGEQLLARVAAQIERRVLPALAEKLDVSYARTGDRAVIMGAGALVLNRQLGVL